jgi:hypothetical protein
LLYLGHSTRRHTPQDKILHSQSRKNINFKLKLAIKSTGFNLHTGSINPSSDRSVMTEDQIKKDELGGARRKQEDEKLLSCRTTA